MNTPIGIGVIGCGDVSAIYLQNLSTKHPALRVAACANRHREAAQAAAERYHIPKVLTIEQLLRDPEVDVVLNLTVPTVHYDICKRALLAGKHIYTEKPLCTALAQAKELQALADQKGLRIGCAPDTFLGGGLQTCRQLLDNGAIGRPLSASVCMAWHGPEHEHPNPAFLYQPGAGPMFDYGPYYMTALIHLLGPARTVCGMAGKGFETRICTCPGKNNGAEFPVDTPTHLTGVIAFQSGVLATVIHSFDVWGHGLPFIEIYGTKGTLRLPDLDSFGGPLYLLKAGDTAFREVPLTYGNVDNSRGIGLADLAAGLAENRPHRASGTLALHALELMHAFCTSAEGARFVGLQTTCERPEPLLRE